MDSYQIRYETIKRSIILEFLADRLEREQALTKYFNSILNVKYIKLRRQEKRDEILNDLNIVKHKSQHLFSSIFSFKSDYLKSIQEYDQLTEHATTSFIIVIDELIGLYKTRVQILRDHFEDEVETLIDSFENDKDVILSKFTESFKDIDDYMLCLEYKNQELLTRNEKNYLNKIEAIKFKHQNEIITLKSIMQTKLENLNKEYEKEKCSFEYLNPDLITKKINKNEAIISHDKLKINEMNAKIKILNQKLDDIQLNFGILTDKKMKVNKKLTDYKNFVDIFEIYSKNLNSKLVNLVRSSHNALEKLKKNYEKLSKIFKMIKMCRQLEKKVENTIKLNSPSPNILSLDQIENELLALNEKNSSNFIDKDNMILLTKFFNLQLNYSKVSLDFYSLKLINQKSKNENLFLKELADKNL